MAKVRVHRPDHRVARLGTRDFGHEIGERCAAADSSTSWRSLSFMGLVMGHLLIGAGKIARSHHPRPAVVMSAGLNSWRDKYTQL